MSSNAIKILTSSLSKLFATTPFSRALSTATAAATMSKLDRIADELLNLTKLERYDYVVLFGLKVGLDCYSLAIFTPSLIATGSGDVTARVVKVVEKATFDIKLEKFDTVAKIKIIKEGRSFTDLGLKEAKDMVEKVLEVSGD